MGAQTGGAANSGSGSNNSLKVQQQSQTMTRSASGADVTEKYLTQLVPVEKLAEILREQTSAKYGINGIVADVFVSQVFPQYTDLGHRLFQLMHTSSKATTKHLGTVAFRQQCERFLGIMDDAKTLECYIKMYAQEDNPDFIDKTGVTRLLHICYTIAMQHSGNAVLCTAINRTFGSVTKSIFLCHDSLSLGYVCRWFEQNLIRLVLLVHKYCVHTLSTAYRGLEQHSLSCGIELQTPVLEQRNPFTDTTDHSGIGSDFSDSLMPLSQAWLLAGALPPLYSKPQTIAPSPSNKANNSASSAVQIFKEKLSMMPSHWTLLYDSNEHGVGANRFLHHVLGYRGPTLVLLHTKDEQTYCVAAPSEWKETHLFVGGEGSCVIQLLPKFVILEKKPNILYLNTSIRGYPKGLRAGADPRKPIIAVDEHFENVDCKGLAAGLMSIEVWGCGDKSSREVQLDIKKWQIREAERQRTVKLTAADWMDHPDRYLLELGGRQNYNN
ncbi:GL18950 [Drosophila persimilis]|uniref:GL18950 n=1 Tax=Drosophila persimilis TaxID=7234 RepID=B4G7U1_DROPE|nr:GL18950 [Drosophila persimilis]